MTCSGSNGNIIASPATATRSGFMGPKMQPEVGSQIQNWVARRVWN